MEQSNIKKLLNISVDLEKLAERFVNNADDEETVRVYGTLLDSARKLRDTAEGLWKDAKEQ